MSIMSVREAAKKWGVSERRVNELIRQGRVAGVYKIGTSNVMPADTQKPPDMRVNNGQNYHKNKPKRNANKDGE